MKQTYKPDIDQNQRLRLFISFRPNVLNVSVVSSVSCRVLLLMDATGHILCLRLECQTSRIARICASTFSILGQVKMLSSGPKQSPVAAFGTYRSSNLFNKSVIVGRQTGFL